MSKNQKPNTLQKLRNKYRLIIYNDHTFEEVWSYRLNRLNVFTLISTTIIVVIGIVYALIAYTPLKAYVIPDFPKAEERHGILMNALKTDSIENQLRMQEQYIQNLRSIISGEEPSFYMEDSDTSKRYNNLSFSPSREDSLLRKEIEEEEEYNLTFFEEGPKQDHLKDLHLCPPVKGFITNTYNKKGLHFGTDIVTTKDDAVHAIYDGVVIFSNWTIETGFVIFIQHENNLVSVYKHNAKLLKKAGESVKTGEAIAIVGNTGEITTGPHLHFELWHKGAPVNAEDYIVF